MRNVLFTAVSVVAGLIAVQAQATQARLSWTEIEQVPKLQTNRLSALSSDGFVRFTHPHFPNHSARIKKTDGFCDGNVGTYTGYIDFGTRHLFFYFFESRNNPATDDVLMWTNGGPGGSSAMGLFYELGPCNIISPNETEYNPYSWNSNANIFFIDQPAGVGFSYTDFDEVISTTEEAAVDIAVFVALFFETFDDFKGRGFHLSGESYAGRYLPVYASAIYDQNTRLTEAGLTPVNLKSVMIGNGATDFTYMYPSYYDIMCTQSPLALPQTISACVRMKKAIPRCTKLLKESCIDQWDHMNCVAAHKFCEDELQRPYWGLRLSFFDVSQPCPGWFCASQDGWVVTYLNNPSIRSILGIDPAFGNFTSPSQPIYQAFRSTADLYHQTQPYVAELLHRGVRVLIYAGDYDFVCNWIGNNKWTLDMEWKGAEEFKKTELRDWFVNVGDKDPAGLVRSSGNFTFATVHGAGHLAPHHKPVESLTMVNRWLSQTEF